MNRAKRFFGRKSVRKLLEESTSNRTDEDNFPGYSDEHLPDFSFPDPIDPMEHSTLATNRETHLSQRVNLNRGKCEMKLRCCWSTVNKWWKAMVAKGECFASIRNQILESPFGMVTSQGMRVDVPIPRVDPSYLQTLAPNFDSIDEATVKGRYVENLLMMQGMRNSVINETQEYYNYLLTERRRSEEMQRQTQELEQELGRMSFRESQRSIKSKKHGEGTRGS